MLLTYQFEINVDEKTSLILGHLCYAASKLFNVGNYERKEYRALGFEEMPDLEDQKERLRKSFWYKSLRPHTAQDILARLDDAWKSYLILHSKWNKKKEDGRLKEYEGEPEAPHYKKDGYHMSVKYFSNNIIVTDDKLRFSLPGKIRKHLKSKYKIDEWYFYIDLPNQISNIQQVEFSYVNNHRYKVHVVYEKKIDNLKKDNKHYISIDIGEKNLLTVYDNKGKSFIVSGQSLLNTNYYFSKKIAYYQAKYDSCYPNHKKGESTKRIKKLYQDKAKRINLILHRSTKMIVDYCLNNDISKVIVGDMSGFLDVQKVLLNHERYYYNQNIRTICFCKIYTQLAYKLQLNGIELITVNEAYSSSCLPTSREVSEKCANKKYRVKRGLIKCHSYIYNSDSVGAFNIMRIYKQTSRKKFEIPLKGLSNPTKEFIPVTDQFLNEDYLNWNGKAGNVGISDRNYPTGYELIGIINQSITQILGNSFTE